MASALPDDVCVGQHSVCIVRAAQLGSGCSAESGEDRAIVTAGIISATASPTIQPAEFYYAPEGPSGDTAWTFVSKAQVTGWTLTGELTYFDHEAMSLLFGGAVIVGDTGTPFEGKSIGWGSPWETDAPSPPLYLEFITKTATADGSTGGPAAVGHIFGRTILKPGDRTFAFDAATMKFTGKATPGGGMMFGPWADWPGAGPIPASPYVQVSYSADEYAAIVDSATCGLTSVPSIEPRGTMTWTAEELASIPTTGSPWAAFVALTDADAGVPDMGDGNSLTAANLYLQAIRWAKTSGGVGRDAIIDKLKLFPVSSTIKSLSVFRQMASIVAASDLVNMPRDTLVLDAPVELGGTGDMVTWEWWVNAMITRVIGFQSGQWHARWYSIRNTAVGYETPERSRATYSNYGSFARLAYIACAFYAGSVEQQEESIASLRQYLGFDQGQTGYLPSAGYDSSWTFGGVYPNTTGFRFGINPIEATSQLAGVMIDDAGRGGPAPVLAGSGVAYTMESWEATAAALVFAAHLGYPHLVDESDQALKRVFDRVALDGDVNDLAFGVYNSVKQLPHMNNRMYGATHPTVTPGIVNQFFGCTDALCATGSKWMDRPAAIRHRTYAASHVSGTITSPSNAVGNTPLTWAGQGNADISAASIWALTPPGGALPPNTIQTVRVLARKGSNTGNPVISLDLYEAGVFVRAIRGATIITSEVGEVIAATFNSDELTDPADAQIRVVVQGMSAVGFAAFGDDFNRFDGNPGSNWITSHPSATTFLIEENEIKHAGTGTAAMRWVADCDTDSVYSEMRYTETDVGVSAQLGPAVLMPTFVSGSLATQGDFYVFQVSGSARNSLSIRRKNDLSSGTTALGSTATFTVEMGDVLRLEVDGLDLVGKVNGVERIRRAKSSQPLTNGGRGVGIYAAANASIRIDDWAGGDV